MTSKNSKNQQFLLKNAKNSEKLNFCKIVSRGRSNILSPGKCAQDPGGTFVSWNVLRKNQYLAF